MNMIDTELELKISQASREGDSSKIIWIKHELVAKREMLNRWFDKYLDLFSEKMSTLEKDDPVWKLYHKKFSEYETVNHAIKTANYFLEKDRV